MPIFHPDPASLLLVAVFAWLTFAVCGASIGLCWVHRARVARIASGQTLALASALKRLPPENRLEAIVAKTPQGSWEHQWALALAACGSAGAKVAVTNELLLGLAHELSAGAGWSASATRTSVLGALLFAVLAALAGGHVLVVACIVATGFGSAVACGVLGAGARHEASRSREAVDSLVDAVLGHMPLPDRAKLQSRLSRAAGRFDRHGRS